MDKDATIAALEAAAESVNAALGEAREAKRQEDAYEVLSHVANAAADLRDIERGAVDWLRSWGGSWQDVGNVYGISRQGAWNRFGEGS